MNLSSDNWAMEGSYLDIDTYITLIEQNFPQLAIQTVKPNVGGKEFVERVLMRYQNTIDTAFWQRIDFYLHYGPFSQLLYGSYSKNETFTLQGIEGLRLMFGE